MTKRKGIKGQQRSTKHTYTIKDRVTRTLLKTGIMMLAINQMCHCHNPVQCSVSWGQGWCIITL